MRSLCSFSKIRCYLNNSTKYFDLAKSNVFHRLTPVYFSSHSSQPDIGNKEHLDDIVDPKKTLWKIINEAYAVHQNPDIKPSVSFQQVEIGEEKHKKWQVLISMTWPEKFQVEGIAAKKADAEKYSFQSACKKLKEYGILDQNNNPVLPEKIKILSEENVRNFKSVLCNIYENIWTHYGKKEYIPKFKSTQIPGLIGEDKYWKSELTLTYPEVKTFEGHAGRLRDAEKIVSAKALQWLKSLGVINSKKRLIRYSKEDDLKLVRLHSTPYSLCIPQDVQNNMRVLLQTYKNKFASMSTEILKKNPVNDSEENVSEVYDIITEKLYVEPTKEDIIQRSENMSKNMMLIAENQGTKMQNIQLQQSQLPIHDKREEILNLIEENQVLVISGETGCGKTTQVPQFILNHFIAKKEGALCNIVVTQPRRISAISMAKRVAEERGENVGETIGHQVRLNKALPSDKGAILYCSTGMLLRKMCSNPNLDGISHVIVDEVHERSNQIDFLLILLKRILVNNSKLKLIIMSASFNTCNFSRYFDNCPVVHVPGRNYPVKDFYLDEILTAHKLKEFDSKNPYLNTDLVVDLINHIDKFEKPGAILCFLPGWNDILNVKGKLMASHPNPSNLMICCAHSRLPLLEQNLLFNLPPPNVRKVILSTNIAETSITVNDVIYVIDSGLYKGTSFDTEHAVASISTQWITKANVRQRSGRAGRVQPGICYHLFTRKLLMNMEDYPLPELLRMPLESVILDCKRYCPNTKAEDFLSAALQAPSNSSLKAGVEELQTIGVLDENELLTELGKIIVNFGTHPRLSVALVYASFLRCFDPVLTICAIITLGEEPFINTLEDKSCVKQIKKDHDNCLVSDHLSLAKIFNKWQKFHSDEDALKFVENNFLDKDRLLLISDLKALFAENLHGAGVISRKDAYSDPSSMCNENSSHVPSILAALAVSFYPNLIKVLQGEISQNRFNKDAIVYSLLKGQRGYIQKESVASNECELPSPWLVYFSALQSKARRLMMTSAVSSIPGICLPLLCGKQMTIDNESLNVVELNETVTSVLDTYKKLNFSCTKEEAELIMQFRNNLCELFQVYILSLNTKSSECDHIMSFFYSDILPGLKNVLETPQVPFTKGQIYKFIDGLLVSEEI